MTKEHMAKEYEDVLSQGKEQFGAAAAATTSFAKTLQTIATETADYSKKTMENNSAFMEKLLGVKSFDAAIQIHSEYWKTSYASFVAQATKIGELYSNLGKEAFKPVETAFTRLYNGKA
ncbi:MAG: phasin family protein [Methylocella sp.]